MYCFKYCHNVFKDPQDRARSMLTEEKRNDKIVVGKLTKLLGTKNNAGRKGSKGSSLKRLGRKQKRQAPFEHYEKKREKWMKSKLSA